MLNWPNLKKKNASFAFCAVVWIFPFFFLPLDGAQAETFPEEPAGADGEAPKHIQCDAITQEELKNEHFS